MRSLDVERTSKDAEEIELARLEVAVAEARLLHAPGSSGPKSLVGEGKEKVERVDESGRDGDGRPAKSGARRSPRGEVRCPRGTPHDRAGNRGLRPTRLTPSRSQGAGRRRANRLSADRARTTRPPRGATYPAIEHWPPACVRSTGSPTGLTR